MVVQPTPNVTGADVERVVSRDFSMEAAGSVMAILERYGTEKWEREVHRVRLSALKLADGDLERLETAIGVAKGDYRDTIAAAEYPEYARTSGRSSVLSAEERQRIVNSDWEQYQAWLAR